MDWIERIRKFFRKKRREYAVCECGRLIAKCKDGHLYPHKCKAIQLASDGMIEIDEGVKDALEVGYRSPDL